MQEKIIETQQLQKIFKVRNWRGQVQYLGAVNDISLYVEAGEIFGFLGPNGAGKSTTLRMLTTLLPPTGGQARVAGYDLLREPNRVREHIGYVSQAGGVDKNATGRENLHNLIYCPDDNYSASALAFGGVTAIDVGSWNIAYPGAVEPVCTRSRCCTCPDEWSDKRSLYLAKLWDFCSAHTFLNHLGDAYLSSGDGMSKMGEANQTRKQRKKKVGRRTRPYATALYYHSML